MARLSDEERRELREMAASPTVRDQFRRLRLLATIPADQVVNLDQFLDFLTAMSHLSARPAAPRPFVPYRRLML
jgi:hypothetical protein